MTVATPALDPLIAEAKRRAHHRRLGIAVAVVAVVAALGTTLAVRQRALPKALAPARTQLPSLFTSAGLASGHSWQVRPTWILITGDGSGKLGALGGTRAHRSRVTWSRWTRTQALGSGTVFTTDKLPSIGMSVFRPTIAKAAVRAFRPVDGHFTRLTLRYADHGRQYSSTFRIRREGKYWQYAPAAERLT
jgi:hypothetical protein